MSLRPATLDDAVPIARMLRKSYGDRGGIYGIPYDHESCILEVAQTINRGIAIIGDGCCAGALIMPFPYNHGTLVAQVVYWYVSRLKSVPELLSSLMERCKAAGATHLNTASIAPEFVGERFYNRRGLSHVESHFLGPLVDCELKK